MSNRDILGNGFDGKVDATALPPVAHGGDAMLINEAEQDFNSNPANAQGMLDAGQSSKLKRVDTVSEIGALVKK